MMGMNHVDPGRHWQSVSLFFSPGSEIQPTDVLRIQKNIFETFLNGDFWNPFVVAEIAEHPTVPEPATLLTAAMGLVGLVFRRRWRCIGSAARSTIDG